MWLGYPTTTILLMPHWMICCMPTQMRKRLRVRWRNCSHRMHTVEAFVRVKTLRINCPALTSWDICRMRQRLRTLCGDNDWFIFYFSGHGIVGATKQSNGNQIFGHYLSTKQFDPKNLTRTSTSGSLIYSRRCMTSMLRMSLLSLTVALVVRLEKRACRSQLTGLEQVVVQR